MRIRQFGALIALILATLAPAQALAAKTVPAVLDKASQPFHRGVNVLGYDPYWTDASKRRFEWRHFTEIRKAGFDYVRLNLQAFKHMNAQNQLEPQWLAKFDDVVRHARAAGLGVIIDEHDFDVCSAEVDTCRTRLAAFWQQVAPRFSRAPRNVAFELLNEPHDKLNGDVWNDMFAQLLTTVRRSNPTRIVVVGPTHWNSLADLPLLKLPGDRNLLVTFHYYEPFKFTHQGATWAGDFVMHQHGNRWGSSEDRAALRADFDKVAAWSAANHRPVFLGEFGAYDKSGTPLDLRVAYIDAVRREAERDGFGWAYWQFEGDFVVWDMAKQKWIEPILRALIPAAESRR